MAPLPMGDVLSPYIYVFYIAFAVAFVLTPMMRRVALYYGIIDEPDGNRKMHSVPVAYLGGAAVFLGWMAGLAFSQLTGTHRNEPGLPSFVVLNIGIVAGAIIIVLLGLWDDVLHVRASTKIRGQVAAAAFLLAQGVGARCAASVLDPLGAEASQFMNRPHLAPITHWLQNAIGWPLAGQFFPDWLVMLISMLFVLVLVVGCCNAANLLDGLDGLCGGVTAIISAGFLFVAIHLASTGSALNSNLDGMRIVLALALLGAVLGFIPFNFNPASIFMGDTGSMFLGYACAVMILLNAEGLPAKWFLASMVIFALPVLDTALALVRRKVNHRPLFSPDRFHFHHQLCARGFSVRKTVVISYLLALGFAMLGCLMVYMRTRFAAAIYLMVFSFIIVTAWKMGMVSEKPLALRQADSPPGDLPPITRRSNPESVRTGSPAPESIVERT